MSKRTQATKHAAIILLIKFISIVLLFLIPVNVQADISVQTSITANDGPPINSQTTDLSYWPPVISELKNSMQNVHKINK